MTSATLSLALLLAATGQVNRYGTIQKDEIDHQKEAFKAWWGDELVLKLDEIPAEGKVPDWRTPYAGHDYPDKMGGTVVALSKYDRAFHSGQMTATEFERRDVSGHGSSERPARRGLFGRIRGPRVPSWYGHCNGWTAATIRHAEPQQSVVRNGVTFTPADIKGLLAEIYMYSPTEFLGGMDNAINPGTLHLVLGNWLGRGSHPVGMESALGEVVINFPIYAFKSKVTKIGDRQHDVRTTITYTLNTPREFDKGPTEQFHRDMFFHYVVDTNEDNEITGGRYYGDSQQVDMLWTPLKPIPGGEKGNERGNPHVDIKEVLAIWRESVPETIRKQWLNVDPTEEDRILPAGEEAKPAEKTASTTPPAAEGTPPANTPATPPAANTTTSPTTSATPAP